MELDEQTQAVVNSVLKLQQDTGMTDEDVIEHFNDMLNELEIDLGTEEDIDELEAVVDKHGFGSDEYWQKFDEQADKRARETLGL